LALPLNKIIKGMAEGLQLVGQGGMIELEIPPSLGYGKRGAARVPAGATLHFLIELIEIKQ
jgi:FKBP-type peptidyl-prolyl cis-trans isomerase